MEIPAPDDPRVHIVIDIGLKGGKALTIRVPRFDFMDETEHEAMFAALKAIDDTPEADMVPRQRVRQAALTMLKPFLTAADYKRCESLPVGPLREIRDHWMEQSGIPLGEFLASVNSSTMSNSEAPSNTTSTSEDGAAATSDAA